MRLESVASVFRVIALAVCLWAALAAAPQASVRADQSDPDLDVLFDRLAAAETVDEAEMIEAEIWRLWLQSGSDSIDLLMRRGLESIANEEYMSALRFLDAVVELEPDFAEGWNKRATVYFLLDNYARSVSDIERVLALEPRHFGALAGLGIILDDTGDKAGALKAYRRALALNPYLTTIEEAVKELEVEVEGQGI